MAALTGNTNVQKYVISRMDYDDEAGYYPTSYIRVNGRSLDCAIDFEGTLDHAIKLAKSKLSYSVKELVVFRWDHENDQWDMEAIISDHQD
jgi:hypothetical protein